MSAVVISDGLRSWLRTSMNRSIRLKLFANDYEPKGSEVVDSFREVSGFGYKDTRLEVVEVSVGPTGVLAAFAPVTFRFEGAFGRVFGSYAVHEASGSVLWADRLEEPFKAVNNGDSLTVEPVFVLAKEIYPNGPV